MQTTNPQIDAWIAARDRSLAETLSALGVDESVVQPSGYGNTDDLVRVYVPDAHPARFYFKGSELVLIYLTRSATQDLDPVAITEALGPPDATVQSRSGKRYKHQIWASAGIAFSSRTTEMTFLEVFPPTTVEAWKAQFYEPVPAFRK